MPLSANWPRVHVTPAPDPRLSTVSIKYLCFRPLDLIKRDWMAYIDMADERPKKAKLFT